MKTYPTTPGVTYAVESSGSVIVSNTSTGAIAVQGDGSGTVYFVATDTNYTLSDDSAAISPLFKLAPRLRLALLQGGAGGWLPKGFTALEYLESSGTQYIELPDVFVIGRDGAANSGVLIASADYAAAAWNTVWRSSVTTTHATHSRTYLYMGIRSASDTVVNVGLSGIVGTSLPKVEGVTYVAGINYLDSGVARISSSQGDKVANLRLTDFNVQSTGEKIRLNSNASCKLMKATFSSGAEITRDLIPVLDAEGVPCLYDKVSKTCLYNAGTGSFGYRIKRTGAEAAPMSLRDPYYTAPSGVYARLSGENELEIQADTEETTGNGWEWFATTAAAYEHFGIVPEMEAEFLTE